MNLKTKVCLSCSDIYQSTGLNQKYCSIGCKRDAYKRPPKEHYEYPIRVCVRCDVEYTPTGGGQKYCTGCKKQARIDKAYDWYHNRGGREMVRNWKIEHRGSSCGEVFNDTVNCPEFRQCVIDIIKKRKGSMLSSKSVTRRALRLMDIKKSYPERGNRGSGKRYSQVQDFVYELLEGLGGIPVSESINAGTHFQFPLKERTR